MSKTVKKVKIKKSRPPKAVVSYAGVTDSLHADRDKQRFTVRWAVHNGGAK